MLQEEHEEIKKVLEALQHEADRIKTTGELDREFVRDAADFASNFADDYHHKKEENMLFQRMSERGMPRQHSPIGMMEHEHNMGRNMVEAVQNELDKDEPDVDRIADQFERFADMLQEHIHKENNVLYPMANKLFTEDDQQELKERFEEANDSFEEDFRDRYVAFAREAVEAEAA